MLTSKFFRTSEKSLVPKAAVMVGILRHANHPLRHIFFISLGRCTNLASVNQ